MPILPTYTASGETGYSLGYHSGGRRADVNDYSDGEGAAALGKAVSRGVDEIGQAESRKALVTSTEIRAQYAQRLDKATITGEDLGAIKEQMNTDLAKVGEGLYTTQGQAELRLHSAQTNMMFDNQANSIAVHRAATDAHIQAGKFLTSTAALFNSDPSYLPFAEADADRLAESFSNVPAEQRREISAKLKNELNVAAAVASARLQPKETISQVQAGHWALTPEQSQHVIAHAEQTQRAMRADENFKREQKARDIRETSDKASDETFKKIRAGTITENEIMNDSRLDQQDREHQIRNLDARAKELATEAKPSDPAEYRRLWLSVHAPDGDPTKVYNGSSVYQAVNEHANGRVGINTADADRLLSQLGQLKDENNVSVSSKLRGMSMNFDHAIAADPRMLRFDATAKAEIQNDFVARVQERVSDLRTANQNPNDAFDPKSKSYVGSREFMQQSIDSAIAKQTGAVKALPAGTEVVRDGEKWRFRGGDPAVKTNWEKATTPGTNTFRSDAEKKVDDLYGPGKPFVKTPPAADNVEAKPMAPVKTEPANQFDKPLKMDPNNEWYPVLNWMFGDDKKEEKPKPAEVPSKKLDDKEKSKVLGEFNKFKTIVQSSKSTEVQRDSALREMIKRGLRLGATRQQIESAIGKPLSKFGM